MYLKRERRQEQTDKLTNRQSHLLFNILLTVKHCILVNVIIWSPRKKNRKTQERKTDTQKDKERHS